MATAKKAPANRPAAKKHTAPGPVEDRRQVSADASYEVAYEARKMGVTQPAVKAAIKKIGNARANIEAVLKKMAGEGPGEEGRAHRGGLARDRSQVFSGVQVRGYL